MKTLVFRDAIYSAAHRWPAIVGSFMVGSLIGILVALVWPSPFRATVELGVGLNLYRADEDDYVAQLAEVPFRNADDYKYWQMQQLEALALSDEYLDETLTRLVKDDVYWREITSNNLREMLGVYWRNAGRWRLAAESSESQYAVQALETWRDVILEKTNNSINNAKNIYVIDLELKRIKDAQLHANSRQKQLAEIKSALTQWQNEYASSSDSLVLNPSDREWLITLGSQAAGFTQSWQMLLSSFPASNAPLAVYLTWVDQLLIGIETESEVIVGELEELQQQSDNLLSEWETALQDGDGLAATLTVELLSGAEPSVRYLRPTATAALVGGLVGLLVWSVISLLRINRGLKT